MGKWASLLSMVGADKYFTMRGRLALTLAYREVFRGKPTKEQQQMVLADLMAKSGWNQVSSGVSSEELWRREGMRSFFGVIFGHLSLAPNDVFELENAARLEAALTMERNTEGNLR